MFEPENMKVADARHVADTVHNEVDIFSGGLQNGCAPYMVGSSRRRPACHHAS